jgi:uncharacterized protein (DUF433 family)
MSVEKGKSVSVKLPPADFVKLQEQARRRSSKPSSVGGLIIAQSLRRMAHPAIEFQETPGSEMCARVAGRRLSVWLVVETLRQCGGNKRKAAEALNLPVPLLVAALEYAAEYAQEIEADARRGRRTLKECGFDPVEA